MGPKFLAVDRARVHAIYPVRYINCTSTISYVFATKSAYLIEVLAWEKIQGGMGHEKKITVNTMIKGKGNLSSKVTANAL